MDKLSDVQINTKMSVFGWYSTVPTPPTQATSSPYLPELAYLYYFLYRDVNTVTMAQGF